MGLLAKLLGSALVLGTVGLVARAWVHRDDDAIGRRERWATTAVGSLLGLLVLAELRELIPVLLDPFAVGLFGLALFLYPDFEPSGGA